MTSDSFPLKSSCRSRLRSLSAAAALGLSLFALGCDDENDGFFGGSPDAPIDLISFTGDGEIILAWTAPPGDEDDVESYNVYALINQTGDFELIGITTSTAFLDNDVVNGQTYFYRVTAVDFDGDESDFSEETFDTPRPDEFNVLMFSVQADPTEAGFDLTTGNIVSSTSAAATFRLDESSGAPRIVPVNGAEVLDVGFVDQLGDVNFAPEQGYFPETVQAQVGRAYIFRIPRGNDQFFGVIRVSHIAAGLMVFDWAFQTDENNRELLRRPVPISVE